MNKYGSNLSESEWNVLTAPIAESMAAFDELPLSIRNDLNNAVEKWSSIQFRDTLAGRITLEQVKAPEVLKILESYFKTGRGA